jgi:hypothetical protein
VNTSAVAAALTREELHHRQVDIRFYRRSDKTYEVTGRLLDTKMHPFRRQLATHDSPAGAALHDIVVELIVDEDLRVLSASARPAVTPFALCREAADTLHPLVGLRIGPGWNKQVRDLLKGAASCTHMVELLGPMATTVFQGTAPQRLARLNDPAHAAERAGKVDSCYAYSAEREVIAQLWPDLRRSPAPRATPG